MERTYNEFVDSGLYVLGYYLKKEIDDITEEDLINSLDLMSKQISRYLYYEDKTNKSYLATITPITNNNSFFTQLQMPNMKDVFDKDVKRDEHIKNELSLLVNIKPSVNDKNCNICNKKKVKINFMKQTKTNENFLVNRTLMAGLCSNTFANSMNNLREIDICPHCLYLAILGTLNVLKATGKHIIINSDSNKFMKKHTEELQYKLIKEGINKDCNKYETENYINLLIRNFVTEQRLKDGNYIQQISFANGQSVEYTTITLEKEKIVFLNRIYNNISLRNFLTNTIFIFDKVKENKNIIFSIGQQYEKGNLTNEELDMLVSELEVYELSKKEKELIRKIVNKLRMHYQYEDIKKKLKLSDDYQKFKEFIIEENANIDLFDDMDDFDILMSKWKTNREYIILQNDILNNKKMKGEFENE